eukprot:scaffold5337_cov411-Prasinococcus_capsulatus_cf.AAC.19
MAATEAELNLPASLETGEPEVKAIEGAKVVLRRGPTKIEELAEKERQKQAKKAAKRAEREAR